jgi:hypothetical protein
MIAIVSGGDDAFENFFMLVAIRRKGRFSSLLSSYRRVPLPPRRDVSPSPSTTAPSAAPSTATADQPHDEEQ